MNSLFKKVYHISFFFSIIFYILFLLIYFIVNCDKEINKINNELAKNNSLSLYFFNEHINFIINHDFKEQDFHLNKYFKNLLIINNNEVVYQYDNYNNLNLDKVENSDLFLSYDVIEDEIVIVKNNGNFFYQIYIISEESKRLFHNLDTNINLMSKKKDISLNYHTIFNENIFSYEEKINLSTQNVYLYTEIITDEIYYHVLVNNWEVFLLSFLAYIFFLIIIYLILVKIIRIPLKDFLYRVEILEENELVDILDLDVDKFTYIELVKIYKVFKNICFYNYNKYENLLQNMNKELVRQKEINKSKLIFLANMSHEMRTPLNAIIGYTQLINRIGFDDKQKLDLYFNSIQKSSEILLQKVNDILDYAKIEQKQFKLQKRPTKLIQVVKEVYDLLSIQAQKKQINFAYYIDNNIPEYLDIDSTRLKQVLINLCSNAIKFTDSGSVELKIKVFGYTNGAIYLEYNITDTGIGISQDVIDTIFIPFVQAHDQDNTYGGTGLGLAIARDLIRLMEGDISITSRKGVGTIVTFITKFPISKIPLEETEEDEYISNELFSEVIKDKQILICEDNIINQVFIKELFNVFNKLDIDIAKDGIEAIDMCKEKVYDLILMDIQMPKLNGIEATKIIRNMIHYKTVPIIALTANAFSDQIKEYLLIGMVDYLAKPINVKHLKKILVKHLRR